MPSNISTMGGRLHHITRHMTGLFHGKSGARKFRRILAIDGVKEGAGPQVIELAFDAVEFADIEHAA